jgi:hypothetical protein
MKALSTVLMAGVEAPNTSVSMRVQMTSNTRPEAPERKKHRKGTRSAWRPVSARSEGGEAEVFVTGRGL